MKPRWFVFSWKDRTQDLGDRALVQERECFLEHLRVNGYGVDIHNNKHEAWAVYEKRTA
jgi:hypothetical protein